MTAKKHGHYRPHKRVQEHGELYDVKTGEFIRPPSMAKQEFKRECDINNVLKQYSKTGMLQHVSNRAATGMYADLPDSYDFQESLHLVRQAETAFMSLPSRTRERFNNDPAQFLAFCGDPANLDEMRKLGLAKAPPRAPDPEPDLASTPPQPNA